VLASGLASAWGTERHRPGVVLDHVTATTALSSPTEVTIAVTIHFYGTFPSWSSWVGPVAREMDILGPLRFLNPEFHTVEALELVWPEGLLDDDSDSSSAPRQRGGLLVSSLLATTAVLRLL